MMVVQGISICMGLLAGRSSQQALAVFQVGRVVRLQVWVVLYYGQWEGMYSLYRVVGFLLYWLAGIFIRLLAGLVGIGVAGGQDRDLWRSSVLSAPHLQRFILFRLI